MADRDIERLVDSMHPHYHNFIYGCNDCELERLRKWMIDNGIIRDPKLGPKDVVDTVIQLINNMDNIIRTRFERIENAKEKEKEESEVIVIWGCSHGSADEVD